MVEGEGWRDWKVRIVNSGRVDTFLMVTSSVKAKENGSEEIAFRDRMATFRPAGMPEPALQSLEHSEDDRTHGTNVNHAYESEDKTAFVEVGK
jgi:hypothetical protein